MDDLPLWNFDGSSTSQAAGDDSEIYIMPRAIFRDPFRGGDNVMVLSECFTPELWGVAVGVHSAAILPECQRAVLFSLCSQ